MTKQTSANKMTWENHGKKRFEDWDELKKKVNILSALTSRNGTINKNETGKEI